VAGTDVPIYPGEGDPIEVEQAQKTAPQAEALYKWEHEEEFPMGEAIDFLSGTIREHPGEVVLLTIGPLTNIGLLFRDHPDIPELLKGLVMMAGNYVDEVPMMEWNSSGDPDATRIVFSSKPPCTRALGLNVTNKVFMKSGDVRERFSTPVLEPVLDFAEIWFRGSEVITFHDPLAAATLFDEGICMFRRGRVEIVSGEKSRSMTLWKPCQEGPHEVAVEVDVGKYFDHFFATIF
jgi:inosine-uridine nucleoside N-ribohydrolase